MAFFWGLSLLPGLLHVRGGEWVFGVVLPCRGGSASWRGSPRLPWARPCYCYGPAEGAGPPSPPKTSLRHTPEHATPLRHTPSLSVTAPSPPHHRIRQPSVRQGRKSVCVCVCQGKRDGNEGQIAPESMGTLSVSSPSPPHHRNASTPSALRQARQEECVPGEREVASSSTGEGVRRHQGPSAH